MKERDKPLGEGAADRLDAYQVAVVRVGGALIALGGIVGTLAALAIGQAERSFTSLPFGLVGFATLFLASTGRMRHATLVMVLGSWVGAANGLLWANGVLSPGATGVFCVAVLLSGWLVGPAVTLGLTLATPVVLFATAYATVQGWPLPRHNESPPMMVVPIISIVVLIAGMLGHFAARSLRTRIEAITRSERALADKVGELSRREVDLESLRRRFEALFRSAPTACALARPGKGEILDCNEAFCELIGRPRDEIIGRDSVSLGYWHDLGERDQAYALLARDGRLRDFEAAFVRPGGEIRHCLIAWEVVEFGGERQMIAQIADITGLRQAEEALADSRATFAAAFEASPDAMVITRVRDQAILEANPAFERLTGIPRAEAVGRRAPELGHWGDLAERERIFRSLAAGQTVIDVPVVGQRRDGTTIECRLSGATVTLRGEPHVLTIAQDVSAQARATAALAASERELAEANRRLRVQLSLHELTERVARVGHWFTDLPNDRVEWSRALFSISGVPPRGPMTSEESRQLIRIEEQDALRAARERLDGTPHVYHFHRSDGSEGWARASLLRAPDTLPESGEFFGVVQDITEEHEAKLALERLNAELEHRVSERTAALRATNAELDAFAYSVAHDLNAPLRSINGFAGILERDAAGRLTEGDRERLGRIRAASVRMSRLIADLLRLSRLTRAPMHLQSVDLSALAREVAAEIATAQPGRSVEWRIDEGLAARADPGLARALLQNLLGNAWKYTRDTPAPVIEFGRADDEGRRGELRVRDNGAGFDMAYAARLFTPFQRLHGPAEFEGSGIGLATVQRIVHRHGGTVRAHAEPGRGASLYFTLASSP